MTMKQTVDNDICVDKDTVLEPLLRRAEHGEQYKVVSALGQVLTRTETGSKKDDAYFDSNNYYRPGTGEAEAAAERVRRAYEQKPQEPQFLASFQGGHEIKYLPLTDLRELDTLKHEGALIDVKRIAVSEVSKEEYQAFCTHHINKAFDPLTSPKTDA